MARLVALSAVVEVADDLRAGAVVAIPTDTVYGLAASVRQPNGVAKLFAIKDRPDSVALPVMVADAGEFSALGATLTRREFMVASRFWPGPLTLVTAAPADLAKLVGSSNGRVGFRIPSHPGVLSLLRAVGPLCVTSANQHGESPSLSAREVLAAFGETPDLSAVVDGGRCEGAVSTVVEVLADSVVVLRAGAISPAQIDAVLHLGG